MSASAISRRLFEKLWTNNPWVQALLYVGAIGAIMFQLYGSLSDALGLSPIEEENIQYVLFSLGGFYLFCAAIIAANRVQLVEQLRQKGQAFWYDTQGTLMNGAQPNISFKVSTFNSFLRGLLEHVGDDAKDMLIDGGRRASQDFAANFPEIYDADVRPRKNAQGWAALSLREKIDEWTDYDSKTGWGLLSANMNGMIVVRVSHMKGLFSSEEDRSLFGYFLAGYCETVLSHILSGHRGGAKKVMLVGRPRFRGRSVEFTYDQL